MDRKRLVPSSSDKILELILTALRDLVDYELAVILKLTESNTLTVQKAQGPLANERIKDFSVDLSRRRDLARIIRFDQPYLFAEQEEHEDTYEDLMDLPEGHSCLVAPLYFQDAPIGLMTLDHSVCNMFSPAIVKFIGTISRLIAVIIAQNESSQYQDTLRRDLTRERNLLLTRESPQLKNIRGDSPAWSRVIDQVKIVAESDLPVLIHGETGTGKEQVARTIHKLSPRNDKPFITLNCSALNASLAESELFGHEKGAFTSAIAQRKGRFEIADGGTLFLDEIADLPMEIQPKLLRTLQEGTFERIGGETTRSCDVRIIAASHMDLKKRVQEGLFREDLYYRLGVYPLELPPLRQRKEDIIPLTRHFAQQEARKAKIRTPDISEEALEGLLRYPWPGNVRELQNAISRGVLLAKGKEIGCHHLGLYPSALVPETDPLDSFQVAPAESRSRFPSMVAVEKRHIENALSQTAGKIYGENGAAALLGMKPTTLQSRIKKLKIKRQDFLTSDVSIVDMQR
ncbi:Transcriptional regulator containing GAF, AAA-type ATPase, and DNA-binding Fis domains [Malonomonas rubra DSM 5091]|uniref:Transcriptional regulator containing GAF, AAA-type ATPase, and DNA-binding Fis domains n=1 Tax=Malonomonas rubra DSM 5091 TaxID=1122189 RepID=A0A1M6H3S9_MALRU|nr:sigma 54-interacting transcriptional regulator [Malonomonas rubra]SHJ16824.1 Transcriptional regulator containing GAF, AAA-type ATPase, and DNA-binding Fis domains [Malonomonas rubra DSM 5091]